VDPGIDGKGYQRESGGLPPGTEVWDSAPSGGAGDRAPTGGQA